MKDYPKTEVVIRKRTEFRHQKEDPFLNSLATVCLLIGYKSTMTATVISGEML